MPEVVIPRSKYVPPQRRKAAEDEEEKEEPPNKKKTVDNPSTTRSKPSARSVHFEPDPLPVSKGAAREETTSQKETSNKGNKGLSVLKKPPGANLKAPIEWYKSGADEDVARKIIKTKLELDAEEILAISPSVRRALIRQTRNAKVTPRTMKTFIQTVDEEDDEEPSPEPFSYFKFEELAEPGFDILLEDTDGMPAGSYVHVDTVEQFRKDRPDPADRGRKIIIASRQGEQLRVVYPQINDSPEVVEAILDSGSQIISMDKTVAVGLGITWTPDLVIHMQSAHGDLAPTKGLARNVPFKFGNMTVFLQVHIIDNAPYEVLVGRPFDVLVESTIRNTKEGDQFITMTDPNSGRKIEVGTYPRGHGVRMIRHGPEVLRDCSGEEPVKETESEEENSKTNFHPSSMNS